MSISPIGRPSSASRTEPPTNRASTPPAASASSTATRRRLDHPGLRLDPEQIRGSAHRPVSVRYARARCGRLPSAAAHRPLLAACRNGRSRRRARSPAARRRRRRARPRATPSSDTALPAMLAPTMPTHSRYSAVGRRSGKTIVRKTRSMASSTGEHLGQIDQHPGRRAPDVAALIGQHKKHAASGARIRASCARWLRGSTTKDSGTSNASATSNGSIASGKGGCDDADDRGDLEPGAGHIGVEPADHRHMVARQPDFLFGLAQRRLDRRRRRSPRCGRRETRSARHAPSDAAVRWVSSTDMPSARSISGTSTAAGRRAVLGGGHAGVQIVVALQFAAKGGRLERVGGAAEAAQAGCQAGQPLNYPVAGHCMRFLGSSSSGKGPKGAAIMRRALSPCPCRRQMVKATCSFMGMTYQWFAKLARCAHRRNARSRNAKPRSSTAGCRTAGRSRGPSSNSSTPSRCWSRWCCRRRRPMPASTRRRRRCSRPPTRRRRCWRSARSGSRLHPHDRPVPHQGEEHRQAVAARWSRAWRQGAARPRGAGKAAGGRAQDRQCRAQRRVRRADDRGRHAYLPGRQPHRHRAGQDAARGRGRAGEDHAGANTSSARTTG